MEFYFYSFLENLDRKHKAWDIYLYHSTVKQLKRKDLYPLQLAKFTKYARISYVMWKPRGLKSSNFYCFFLFLVSYLVFTLHSVKHMCKNKLWCRISFVREQQNPCLTDITHQWLAQNRLNLGEHILKNDSNNDGVHKIRCLAYVSADK